jgi:hypothetical protein
VQSFEKFHKVWAFIPLTAEQLRQAIGAVEVAAGLGSLKKATRTLSYLVLTAIYAGKSVSYNLLFKFSYVYSNLLTMDFDGYTTLNGQQTEKKTTGVLQIAFILCCRA